MAITRPGAVPASRPVAGERCGQPPAPSRRANAGKEFRSAALYTGVFGLQGPPLGFAGFFAGWPAESGRFAGRRG